MAYGIVRCHKVGEKNIKQPDNTTDTYSAPSTPSYSYDKLHKYTDISSKNHSLQRKMLKKW